MNALGLKFNSSTLAEPSMADFSQYAQGSDTRGRGNNTIALAQSQASDPGATVIAPSLHATALGNPVVTLLLVIGLYFGAKFLLRKIGGGGEAKEVVAESIGVRHLFVTWLSVLIVIPLSKWIFTKWQMPGISLLVNTM